MECTEGWDTCFCFSMGANRAEEYSAAVRHTEEGILWSVKDEELAPHFAGCEEVDWQLQFIEKNQFDVKIP